MDFDFDYFVGFVTLAFIVFGRDKIRFWFSVFFNLTIIDKSINAYCAQIIDQLNHWTIPCLGDDRSVLDYYVPRTIERSPDAGDLESDLGLVKSEFSLIDQGVSVLTGEQGIGKTMLFKSILRSKCELIKNLGKDEEIFEKIPVYIDLEHLDMNSINDVPPISYDNFLFRSIVMNLTDSGFGGAAFSVNSVLIKRFLHQGKFLFLIDHVDRIVFGRRREVISAICRFASYGRYRKNIFVVSIRTSLFEKGMFSSIWKVYNLPDFKKKEVDYFLVKNAQCISDGDYLAKLQHILTNDAAIIQLAKKPLFLHGLLLISSNVCGQDNQGFEMPASRKDLFDRAIDALIERSNCNSTKENDKTYKRRILVRIAVLMHISSLSDHCFPREDDLREVSREELRSIGEFDLTDTLFTQLLTTDMFWRNEDGRYGYRARSLQDYLVSLNYKDFSGSMLVSEIEKNGGDLLAWEEIIRHWCEFGSDATALVQYCIEKSYFLMALGLLSYSSCVEEDVALDLIEVAKKYIDELCFEEDKVTIKGVGLPVSDLSAVFGGLAVSKTIWGDAIYEYLISNIVDRFDGMIVGVDSVGAFFSPVYYLTVEALSKTYRLEAKNALDLANLKITEKLNEQREKLMANPLLGNNSSFGGNMNAYFYRIVNGRPIDVFLNSDIMGGPKEHFYYYKNIVDYEMYSRASKKIQYEISKMGAVLCGEVMR